MADSIAAYNQPGGGGQRVNVSSKCMHTAEALYELWKQGHCTIMHTAAWMGHGWGMQARQKLQHPHTCSPHSCSELKHIKYIKLQWLSWPHLPCAQRPCGARQRDHTVAQLQQSGDRKCAQAAPALGPCMNTSVYLSAPSPQNHPPNRCSHSDQPHGACPRVPVPQREVPPRTPTLLQDTHSRLYGPARCESAGRQL